MQCTPCRYKEAVDVGCVQTPALLIEGVNAAEVDTVFR